MSTSHPHQHDAALPAPASPTDPARLNLLFDVLLNVARGNDEDELLRQFASQLSWVLDFERCWFGFKQRDGTVSCHASTYTDAPDAITSPERDLLAAIIREGTNRRVEQTESAETLLCLPLTVGAKTRGAMLLVSGRDGAFSRDDIRFANAAATFLALALDRLRRIAALAQSNEELQFAFVTAKGEGETGFEKSTIVRETGDETTEVASFDDALDAWARQARNLIGAHQGAVSYFPHGKIAEGQHAITLSDKYEKYRTYDVLPSGEGIWKIVIEKKLSFCLTDEELKSHAAWKNFSDLRDDRGLEHPPMRGWLAVPVLSREQEFVGLLQLSDKYEGDFTQDDLQRITRLAQLMAPAFSLQYANEQLQRRNAELTSAKDALEQSNVELRQFAYIASHDLQTPLRTISGFAQLLKEKYADKIDEQADDWIERTVKGTRQMQTLIDDLMSFSRVDVKSRAFQPTNFGEVFDDTVNQLEESIIETGAEVTRDELPTLIGDRSQLVQLFQNLIGNGIKYHGDQSPQIHVSARQDSSEWLFSVRDNGIGIKPKHAERVFEIFKRLHTDQKYPGTGIGLAICRRVVQRHGGRIWLESKPGEGSTFFFTIPNHSVA